MQIGPSVHLLGGPLLAIVCFSVTTFFLGRQRDKVPSLVLVQKQNTAGLRTLLQRRVGFATCFESYIIHLLQLLWSTMIMTVLFTYLLTRYNIGAPNTRD